MPEKPLALSWVGRKSSTSLAWEEGLVLSEESSQGTLSPAPCWCPGGKEGKRAERWGLLMPASNLLFLPQIELKAGKGAGDRTGPEWKAALQREREEQQHLLAESYSAVMELTRQLQVSERNWSQEKLQLVERLQGEKQQVEQQVKELQNRLSQVRPVPAQAGSSHRGSHCGKRPGVGAPSGRAASRCSENTGGTASFSLPVSQTCFPLCVFLKQAVLKYGHC